MAGKINPTAAAHADFAVRIIPYKHSGDDLSQVAKQNAAGERGGKRDAFLAATSGACEAQRPLGYVCGWSSERCQPTAQMS